MADEGTLKKLEVDLVANVSQFLAQFNQAEKVVQNVSENMAKYVAAASASIQASLGVIGASSVAAFAEMEASATAAALVSKGATDTIKKSFVDASSQMVKTSEIAGTEVAGSMVALGAAANNTEKNLKGMQVADLETAAANKTLLASTQELTKAQTLLSAQIKSASSQTASQVKKDTEDQATSWTKYAKSAAKDVGAIVLALGALAAASVYTYAKFEDALNNSVITLEGINAKLRTELEATARQLAVNGVNSATDLAKSYEVLNDAGLNASQSLKAIGVADTFATANHADLMKATESLARAQQALGLQSKDVAENTANLTAVSDALTTAATFANSSAVKLGDALATSGRSVRQLAGGMNEGIAAIAVFTTQGKSAGEAGANLDSIIKDLNKSVIDNKQAWLDFGISSVDAQGNLKPLSVIANDLNKKIGGLGGAAQTEALHMLGFGRSVEAMKALIGSSNELKDFQAQLDNAGGTSRRVADDQLKTLTAQFKQLKNGITEVLLGIGQQLSPVINAMIQLFKNATDGTGHLNENFQRLVDFITAVLITGIGVIADSIQIMIAAFKGGEIAILAIQRSFTAWQLIASVAVNAVAFFFEDLWKKLRFGGTEVQAIFYAVLAMIQNGIASMVNSVISGVNSAIAALNKIAGIKIEPIQFSAGKSEFFTSIVADLEKKMAAIRVETVAGKKAYDDSKTAAADFFAKANKGADDYSVKINALGEEVLHMMTDQLPSNVIKNALAGAGKAAEDAGKKAKDAHNGAAGAAKTHATAVQEVVKIYNEVDLVKLKQTIRDPWEAALPILAQYNAMLKDGVISQSEYARAVLKLNLKGDLTDPIETGIDKIAEMNRQLKAGIISYDEYAKHAKDAAASASSFIDPSLLAGVTPKKGDLTGPAANFKTGDSTFDQTAQYQLEQQALRDNFTAQRSIIEKMTFENESAKIAILKNMDENYMKQLTNFQNQRNSLLMTSMSSSLDSLANVLGDSLGKQSGAYKAMFAASKAFAIADATVKIAQGVAAAAANPWPLNLAAIASTIAATASLISNIESVALSFEGGGMTPQGPRIGGLDGKGGRMAIMHPNERVIDLEKGEDTPRDSGTTVVNVNQNFTGGVTEKDLERRAKTIKQETLSAVPELVGRAGAFRKGVHQ